MPRISRIRSLTACVAVAFAVLASVCTQSAMAVIYASDDYESYTTGILVGQGAAGGGWAGAYSGNGLSTGSTVVTKSLSYASSGINIIGGDKAVQLQIPNNSTAISRQLSPAPTASTTVYMSLLFRTEGVAANNVGDFIHFMLNNDTTNTNSAGIGELSTTTLKLGARTGNSNGGDTTSSAQDMTINQTFLLVAKLTDSVSSGDTAGEYDTITLWVNPTSYDESSNGAIASAVDFDLGTNFSIVNYFTVRTEGLSTGDLYFYDSLRFGSDYLSVVPEPGAAAILAPAALALLARRRRKSA